MTDDHAYPYASGDLLEHRNTYFYTRYRGAGFLEAWRRQRDEALQESPSLLDGSVERDRATSRTGAIGATHVLLESIYEELRSGGAVVDRMHRLDRLVQRFEVSKRLHGQYDEEWRPVDKDDFRSLSRYVRFAEVLDAAHERTGALPYLNALLKVVDTLTALATRLNSEERARVRRVVEREREHVARVALRVKGHRHAA